MFYHTKIKRPKIHNHLFKPTVVGFNKKIVA